MSRQDRDYEQSSLWIELVFSKIVLFFTNIKHSLGTTGFWVDQLLRTLEYEILLESLLCFARDFSWIS